MSPHNFLPDEREHLVLGGTFQPVVCRSLHRWEFENLEPASEALPNSFVALVRAADFLVELGDVGGDLPLGFRLGLAENTLRRFTPCSSEVPDDTLPAAIGSAKHVAVGGESFLWHGWWFLLPGCFSTTNTTGYVGPMSTLMFVTAWRKIFPAFWWFYTCRWAGIFLRAYSLFSGADFEVALAGYRRRKKRGIRGLSPAQSARRTAGRSACPAEGRKLPRLTL